MDCGALVLWALFGFIVGAIAKFFWPGRQPIGCLGTITLGVAGSVVGGLVTQVLMHHRGQPFHPAGLLMSIVGAILVLWFASMMTRGPDV